MPKLEVYGIPVFNPQRTFILSIDKADEEDMGVINVWDKKEHTLTYMLSFARWQAKARREFHSKKKALRYAVTHGYTIRLIFENDGMQSFSDITKPRELNIVFRFMAYVPRMRIIKNGKSYIIRKGRLHFLPVWSDCKEMMEKYEKLFSVHNNY